MKTLDKIRSTLAGAATPTLFDQPAATGTITNPRIAPARRTDPVTSAKGAVSVKMRAGTQKARLLAAYATVGDAGFTDDQAADKAGLLANVGACWWHRCSDLRADGLIEHTGETRVGLTGEERMVCVITDAGYDVLTHITASRER